MRPPPWKRGAPALRSAGREVSASASVKPQCRTPHIGRQPGRHFNPKDLEIYPRRITVFFLISVGRRSPVVRGALSENSFLFVPARASPHPCCERAVFVKFFHSYVACMMTAAREQHTSPPGTHRHRQTGIARTGVYRAPCDGGPKKTSGGDLDWMKKNFFPAHVW